MPSRKDKSSRSRKRGRKSDKSSRSRKRTKESRRRSALAKLHSLAKSGAKKSTKSRAQENRMYKRILQDAGLISRTGKRLF